MRLQTSKQSSVVMLKVKVLQSQFGVFDGDLVEIEMFCYYYTLQSSQRLHKKAQDDFQAQSLNPITSVLSL